MGTKSIALETVEARAPIGAGITLETDAGKHIRRFVTSDSFLDQHPFRAHFGLGNRTTVNRLTVQWPEVTTHQIVDSASDQWHRLDQVGFERSDSGGRSTAAD